MPLTTAQLRNLEAHPEGIPVGKVLCIARAAFRFYKCWKRSQSDTCVKTFISDIEKCLKKK